MTKLMPVLPSALEIICARRSPRAGSSSKTEKGGSGICTLAMEREDKGKFRKTCDVADKGASNSLVDSDSEVVHTKMYKNNLHHKQHQNIDLLDFSTSQFVGPFAVEAPGERRSGQLTDQLVLQPPRRQWFTRPPLVRLHPEVTLAHQDAEPGPDCVALAGEGAVVGIEVGCCCPQDSFFAA